jgi:class 3 adenylate cyclase
MADEPTTPPLMPVAVLVADISGSTTMYVERGDTTAFALATGCLTLLEDHVRDAGGRVVKRMGDGILAVFDRAEDAMAAAIAIRRTVEAPDCTLGRDGIRVRIGISSGTAVVAEGDVYGDVVNVAARLVGVAGPDEVFLSGQAYEDLPLDMRTFIRLIDHKTLRNRPGAIVLYQYLSEAACATEPLHVRMRSSPATLEVTYGDRVFVVGPERPMLKLGREPTNDIAVDRSTVSRHHAEIAMRGDKFVLIDRSTNGTYVHLDNGQVLRILREDITLSASGSIILGLDTEPAIRYRIATSL